MKLSKALPRITTIVYRFLLPACILISLLFISLRLERNLFLGSLILDWIARIWISLGFSYIYINLSDLDKYVYRIYRMLIEPSHSLSLNWQNIVLGSVFGMLSIPFTWWVILTFLPIFAEIALILSIMHGLILSLPIIVRRKKFMP